MIMVKGHLSGLLTGEETQGILEENPWYLPHCCEMLSELRDAVEKLNGEGLTRINCGNFLFRYNRAATSHQPIAQSDAIDVLFRECVSRMKGTSCL